MAVFKVPIVPSLSVHPCIFEFPLPDERNCPVPGRSVQLTIFILHLIHPGSKVKFIKATGYSFRQVDPILPDDSTIMGQIYNGKGDLSPAFMALTHSRAKHVRYLTPFLETALAFVWKPVKKTDGLATIYQLFPCIFVLFGLALFLGLIIRWVISRGFGRWDPSLGRRFSARSGVAIFLGLALLTGCIRSHVVMVFHPTEVQNQVPFRNLEDLAKRLETNEYTAIAGSKVYMEELLNAKTHKGRSALLDRFMEIAKYNPPKLVPAEKAAELIINGTGKYVMVTERAPLKQWKTRYCGFDYTIDSSFYLAPYTMYVSKNWNQSHHLNSFQIHLIKKHNEYLELKYGREKRICGEIQLDPFKTLRWEHSQGAFYMLAYTQILAFGWFLLELLWFYGKRMIGSGIAAEQPMEGGSPGPSNTQDSVLEEEDL